MSEESTVRYLPWEKSTTAPVGRTLLETAEDVGVGIESLCGGAGLCGTCTVVVDDQSCLEPPTEADETVLSDEQLSNGYRLSCRARTSSGGTIDVTVPSVSQSTGGVVLTEGRELEIDLDAAVTRYHLALDAPTLEDNVADCERLQEALDESYGVDVESIDARALRELPNRLRGREDEGRLQVTATVYDDREIVDVTPGLAEEAYGLAVDIGTTTLAVYLIDLRTGATEGVSSMLNPQSRYGGDIMTRVRYTRRNDDGREDLQTAIVDGVNDCIDEAVREAGVDRDAVYEGVFVGNTAMHHLFLGIEPSYVAGSPYVAATHAPVEVKARELGIEINPSGTLYWLPISGGWVGPDKVSVLLVSGHHRDEEMTVCIDIGTNGEISVGNRHTLWTTSAPAGPALEGAEITHGVRAQPGAIDHVTVDPETLDPAWETIDDAPPNGVCGSGIIDLLAGFLVSGVVDRRGQFRDEVTDHPRLRRNEDDVVEYVLVRDDESSVDGDVVVTQNDVREIQMAKAAIQAGTLVLMDELDVDHVDRVVLAGGFGNYIDPVSAMTVGLYPDVPFDRVESLGNAAGVGAQLALLDRSAREEARRVVDRTQYFEIAGTDVFRDNFMEAMYLPHQRLDLYPSVEERITAVRDLDDVPAVDR